MEERLQKIIAHAGMASRREAETLIEEGMVTVNGHVVTELGAKADPEKDHIKVRGKLIRGHQRYVYVLLNKPKGVLSTVHDPEERPTVVDIMQSVKERIYPVGRLDMNTDGALLLTNDGELTQTLLAPRNKCLKTYLVKVSGLPRMADVQRLERGITVDGARYAPCKIDLLKAGNNSWLKVELHEGKNHQIKKMFQAIGFPVAKLHRIAFAFLTTRGLKPGEFRELTEFEIARLKRGEYNPLVKLNPFKFLKEMGVAITDKDWGAYRGRQMGNQEEYERKKAEEREAEEASGRRPRGTGFRSNSQRKPFKLSFRDGNTDSGFRGRSDGPRGRGEVDRLEGEGGPPKRQSFKPSFRQNRDGEGDDRGGYRGGPRGGRNEGRGSDDRGGQRGGYRGGPRGDRNEGRGSDDRGGYRGGPRGDRNEGRGGDDRGGQRGGYRGGPRGDRNEGRGGDDRGGQRGGYRGGPRGDRNEGRGGDDRGGQRGGYRGGPRGDRNEGRGGDDRGGQRGGYRGGARGDRNEGRGGDDRGGYRGDSNENRGQRHSGGPKGGGRFGKSNQGRPNRDQAKRWSPSRGGSGKKKG